MEKLQLLFVVPIATSGKSEKFTGKRRKAFEEIFINDFHERSRRAGAQEKFH
jgi:hypothetical protein